MNKRQEFALNGATTGLLNRNISGSQECVSLKGLKLSTALTVDYLGGAFAWHASVAVVDERNLMPIPPNKVSKAKQLRVRLHLAKMLQGVGSEILQESEAYGAFNLFKSLTIEESSQIKSMAA